MPNQRVFQVQGLTLNGINVGGTSLMQFTNSYRDVLVSTLDGAFGREDVDLSGQSVSVNIVTKDVMTINDLLVSTPGTTTFYGRESGAATWRKYTVTGIVSTNGRLQFTEREDGTLSITAKIRFADETKTFSDVIIAEAGVETPPTLTYPARLYRPKNASFDPDLVPGSGDVIAPIHTTGLSLSIAADVLEDFSDDDVGHTAIDIAGWQPPEIELQHNDASVINGSHITSKLLAAGKGILTVGLSGRGGAEDKILTVRGLRFNGSDQREDAGFSSFTLKGTSAWKNNGTFYNLGAATKIFEIA